MYSENKKTIKRNYHSPNLIRYGDVSQLTKASSINSNVLDNYTGMPAAPNNKTGF